MNLLHQIGKKPIIAAVRNPKDAIKAIASNVDNVFFMGGTIKEVIEYVSIVKQADKGTFIHLDLIRGLSNTDKESVEFIADSIGADGIVTPKNHLIREAKKNGLYGILHLFIIDSKALQIGLNSIEAIHPDGIEIMPGTIYKTISQIVEAYENIPIIASGLINDKEEVIASLNAGATSLSISDQKLWPLTFEDLQ